jgi:ribosomal protein L11 methyltransferase
MSDLKHYIEASIEVPNEIADAVCNFIIENISSGLILEEEEKSNYTGIKFYLPRNDDKKFRQKLSYYFKSLIELNQNLDNEPIIKERIIENVEWEAAYKDSVESIIIDDKICIRPPWDEKPSEAIYDIIIEPKMAFGTGTHETTRSCLSLIKNSFKENTSFLDIGCGSGILSILAHQMGASYIKAIDYDKIAVENSRENFKINSVDCPSDIVIGTIEKCQDDKPYDFVCANIIKVTILEIFEDLLNLTKDSGYLLLSGLLDIDEEEIINKLNSFDLKNYIIHKDNEWRSFLIHKR